jgi:4Fe-4S ferredoxin
MLLDHGPHCRGRAGLNAGPRRFRLSLRTTHAARTGPASRMTAKATTETCTQLPGTVVPVIDRTRCEGKEDCAAVCPYDVFEIRSLSREERASLPFGARIKAMVHGNRQSFAVRADACHSCGLCVASCPERAIRLTRLAA